MDIKENVVLSPYSTYKIGGKARYFVIVKSKKELVDAVCFAKKKLIKFYVIGNGSNIIFSSLGYDGLIIVNRCSNVEIKDNIVDVDAGHILGLLIKKLSKKGLSGMENLIGIPGTLGGAIYQNAGAYGAEICDVVQSVEVLDNECNQNTISKAKLNFGYRYSIFKENRDTILSVKLNLEIKKIDEINKLITNISSKRVNKPAGKNCGSFFKNPENYSAGKLIDDAGLKGLKIGGAQISELHANYIINIDNASSDDIIKLSLTIKEVVLDKFQVLLEEEVQIIPC